MWGKSYVMYDVNVCVASQVCSDSKGSVAHSAISEKIGIDTKINSCSPYLDPRPQFLFTKRNL